jgi:hypothetical protein
MTADSLRPYPNPHAEVTKAFTRLQSRMSTPIKRPLPMISDTVVLPPSIFSEQASQLIDVSNAALSLRKFELHSTAAESWLSSLFPSNG